jgi:glycosyltransferase involved in cell wall biosynthesis
MACGTPVITSNTSSMPEIGGSEVLMVNPQNVNEITEKMLLLEKDEALYQKQKEIGIRRAQQFSWKYTAEQLLMVYDEVYRNRQRD